MNTDKQEIDSESSHSEDEDAITTGTGTQINVHAIITKRRKIYKQQFIKSWESKYTWLTKDCNERSDLVFCKCCNKTITCNLGHIKRHELTKLHEKNTKSLLVRQNWKHYRF